MSTQTTETVKDVRILVSFYAYREDGNVGNELVHEENIFWRKRIQKPRYILYWHKDSCRT